jgi:hypothetical protein
VPKGIYNDMIVHLNKKSIELPPQIIGSLGLTLYRQPAKSLKPQKNRTPSSKCILTSITIGEFSATSGHLKNGQGADACSFACSSGFRLAQAFTLYASFWTTFSFRAYGDNECSSQFLLSGMRAADPL